MYRIPFAASGEGTVYYTIESVTPRLPGLTQARPRRTWREQSERPLNDAREIGRYTEARTFTAGPLRGSASHCSRASLPTIAADLRLTAWRTPCPRRTEIVRSFPRSPMPSHVLQTSPPHEHEDETSHPRTALFRMDRDEHTRSPTPAAMARADAVGNNDRRGGMGHAPAPPVSAASGRQAVTLGSHHRYRGHSFHG